MGVLYGLIATVALALAAYVIVRRWSEDLPFRARQEARDCVTCSRERSACRCNYE